MVNEEENMIMAGRTLEEMIFEVGIKDELIGLEELQYRYMMGLVGTKKLTRDEFYALREHVINALNDTISMICETRFEDILEEKVRFAEELQE